MYLKTGRDLRPNAGIIGLSEDGEIGGGYDQMIRVGPPMWEGDDDCLTPDECMELADRMIVRWQVFRSQHERREAMAGTALTKLIAVLRDDGTIQEWDDQRAAAATELQRLAWHIEWVIDHSNDPSVVRECRMTLGLPIFGGHPAT